MSKTKLQRLLAEIQKEVERVEKQADLEQQLEDHQTALAAVVRTLRQSLRITEGAIKYSEKDGYLPISLIRWEERRDAILELIDEAKYYTVTKEEFDKQEADEHDD